MIAGERTESTPAVEEAGRPTTVGVVGAGSWGTTLAVLLARKGHT
ncbi:MAG: hypothetical protein ACOC8K_02280, partial [Gemmatimonadota bacterium]